MLQRCPSPNNGLSASHSLQTASHTIGMRWFLDCPALAGVTGVKGFPSPERFQESLGLLSGVGWRDSGVGQGSTDMCCPFWDFPMGALQSSAGNSWVPHIQDSEWQPSWPWNVRGGWEGFIDTHLCTDSTSTDARVEPPVRVTAPSELSALEPGEAAPPEELALALWWRPPPPPGFSFLWADESDSIPPEQAD